MAGQYSHLPGYFLRRGTYGRGKPGLEAENRTAVPVSGRRSPAGEPDLLRIGAETEMRLYLIRHGKTEANEKRLYCGSTDLPLSEKGREELKLLHYDISNVRFLTSGMKRTNETLGILFGDVPWGEDPGFREVDFGIFEMHSYEQLKDLPAYQNWISGDNEINIPPEGESGAQMKRRVLEAYQSVREDTVLICHGGVIAALMEHLFPEEQKSRYAWQPANGHGYAIEDGQYRCIP